MGNAEQNQSQLPTLAVSLREASRITGISRRKLWQLGKDGAIGRVVVGRSVRYLVADLQRFLEDHRR
jgi:predicted DNA-binding transcriptional regulator AlpA